MSGLVSDGPGVRGRPAGHDCIDTHPEHRLWSSGREGRPGYRVDGADRGVGE